MQPMMQPAMGMGARAVMPESEKAEAYGFDVLGPGATRADATQAHVWFEVENIPVQKDRFAPVVWEPRIVMKMRSFADPQALHSVLKMPAHEQAYPRQWAAFVRGQEDVPVGTPIDELPRVSRLTRETLRAMGVLTIEQAAELPEQARQRLGLDGDRVAEIAKAWLRKEAGGDVADLAAEVAAMRAALAESEREKQAMALQVAATQQALSMVQASKGMAAAAGEPVTVNPDPDYSDMPFDALAGDGDDDGMDDLLKP